MREIRYEVDGEPVSGVVHDPAGPAKGAVVFVHGFLSQRAEFAEAPQRLAAQGWRALAFDQRGFGASGGPRGRISAPRATADILGALDHLEKAHPGEPAALVGHSMGACFALGAMAKAPSRVRAAVLAAPMQGVRAEVGHVEFAGYRLARLASNIAQRAGLGSLSVPYKYRERDLFLDADARRRAEQAGFLGRKIDLANFNDVLDMDSTLHARQVRAPVLVLLADKDRAVSHASSRRVFEALGGPKELVTIHSGHSMFGDLSADEVVRQVDRWLTTHLA